ncbi:oxidoreductase domain-containing protein [Rutstroemia sp. NJR-2017a BBW]|nr:oxidoreductase domain-containing protein [Rutstroemia sp. NJR-2017a BBW]
MAEMSAGAHGNAEGEAVVENDGWRPAMVNAGVGREFLATEYRNSDRIIWDEKEVVGRLWKRVCQAEVVEEDIALLEGEKWKGLLGPWAVRRGEKWKVTERGLNERMRFLRYGSGQYFKEHTDGAYGNAEGEQSFFTIHVYFNDSAQELEKEGKVPPKGMLRGGATTFHSTDMKERLDVDPKIGRVLIFQHRRLLHSGDNVVEGIKLTMRSDIMYKLEVPEDDGDVVFGE